MRLASASAPGKVILFGEHAVVYGQPAIAVPLSSVQATVIAEQGAPGTGLVVDAPQVAVTVCVTNGRVGGGYYNALVYPAQITLEALQQPIPDMRMTLTSTIPIASGLGSGAAIATAIIRGLSQALDASLDLDELNDLVYNVEMRHHGTPSGIDNTVIVYEQPVYFVRGEPIETFHIAEPLTLLVADSGQASPTRTAVEDVRALYDSAPEHYDAIFAEIGQIAQRARAAIESGALAELGELMTANHALLQDITVSSEGLDRLVAAAQSAGALGAKLSGGGRGGNMIALVTPDRAAAVSRALYANGAVTVLETTVQPAG